MYTHTHTHTHTHTMALQAHIRHISCHFLLPKSNEVDVVSPPHLVEGITLECAGSLQYHFAWIERERGVNVSYKTKQTNVYNIKIETPRNISLH